MVPTLSENCALGASRSTSSGAVSQGSNVLRAAGRALHDTIGPTDCLDSLSAVRRKSEKNRMAVGEFLVWRFAAMSASWQLLMVSQVYCYR
jgi:hypothetical protein